MLRIGPDSRNKRAVALKGPLADTAVPKADTYLFRPNRISMTIRRFRAGERRASMNV